MKKRTHKKLKILFLSLACVGVFFSNGYAQKWETIPKDKTLEQFIIEKYRIDSISRYGNPTHCNSDSVFFFCYYYQNGKYERMNFIFIGNTFYKLSERSKRKDIRTVKKMLRKNGYSRKRAYWVSRCVKHPLPNIDF